jgi:hypothetical protein
MLSKYSVAYVVRNTDTRYATNHIRSNYSVHSSYIVVKGCYKLVELLGSKCTNAMCGSKSTSTVLLVEWFMNEAF